MSSCTTLPGVTHASIEYSPVALTRVFSFLLAAVEACALPPAKFRPQPPNHCTLPDSVRSMAGSTPLVSYAVAHAPVMDWPQVWPVLNSYIAITVESSRWPPEAIVPSYKVVALLVKRFGSTVVGVMPAAKFVIAACIAFASFVQLADQQLWDSLRKRST